MAYLYPFSGTYDSRQYYLYYSSPPIRRPLRLVTVFIERDELDIHDIPIAKITDDFLGYIRHMERMNIDLASEFILVAATLCRIKAKLLIPRKPVDEEGNEIDPREELVLRPP
jgi:segregation and condensation protein A